ncbi:MAG: hypothetical protein HQ513_18875, partial [Rhodospirillales bacterium]|nr:hypothetical protein [Rhodospirillales bacterium]
VYSGCAIGGDVLVGNNAVLREHTKIGDNSVFGTGSLCEGHTKIGHHTMVGKIYVTDK